MEYLEIFQTVGGEKLTIILLALLVCFIKRTENAKNNLLK